jgi:nitrite reductase/ring-hydroxylating ferredoxin subunit
VFLGSGGWLGGTLVYRNQIGVDHRYAEAGKWNELSMHGDAGHWIPVARVGELKPNQMKLVHINDQRVVVACHEHGFTAFDDRCTHRGGSLADGVLIAGTVQCPWHGSQFDAHTGQCVGGPATQNIHCWDVRTENGQVLLRVDKRFVDTYRPEQHERASASMQ